MLPQPVDLRPVRKATLSICQSSFNGNIEKLCLHNNISKQDTRSDVQTTTRKKSGRSFHTNFTRDCEDDSEKFMVDSVYVSTWSTSSSSGK